ncbi:MAG: pseudouridine synthase [Desulfuromonas sp.]|nr:pseudouridine synthase [Desulfuromonas sp.]
MAISNYPSKLVLPQAQPPYPTLLDFLDSHFPRVGRQCWVQRLAAGKVTDGDGRPLSEASPYVPQSLLCYFREVIDEPHIPFTETILYEDEELLVADKPHFLPVTPGGRYVTENLLYRLRATTGNDQLVPLHRIDRFTAGLVMFGQKSGSRARYNQLFSSGQIYKTYLALGHCPERPQQSQWTVKNRIKQSEPWFCRQVVDGEVNAHSQITLLAYSGSRGLFELHPITGKTHQLRIHMSGLGFGIVNDRYYPQLLPEQPDDFSKPLQLLAKRVEFTDPLTGLQHNFCTDRELLSL